MNVDFINTIVKVFFVEIFSFIICMKLINNKDISWYRKIIIILMSVIATFIYIGLKQYTELIFAICMLYFITSITMKYATGNNIGNSMLLSLVSLSICLLSFMLAVAIEYIPFHIFKLSNKFLNLIIILLIQYFIIQSFFRIRRFRNGILFLKNTSKNDFIDLIMINISSIIIFVYCLLGSYYGNLTRHILIIFFIQSTVLLISI